jgi:nucleotide-binding universal stress UspA family protein
MMRSILVALDDTPGSAAALALAVGLARQANAVLTGAAILDRPHRADEHEAVPIGAGAFKRHRDLVSLSQGRAECDARFDELRAHLPAAHTLLLEDAPAEALIQAAASHDLLVMGRDATLGLEQADDGVAPTLTALVAEAPRPVLAVPPGASGQGPVLVAYDGSVPAMRAVHLFALLGLGNGRDCTVLTVGDDHVAARHVCDGAAALLRAHGLAAHAEPVQADDAVAHVLERAARMGAGLLVMGAYEESRLTTFFTGSATEQLLRDAPCPVFVAR